MRHVLPVAAMVVALVALGGCSSAAPGSDADADAIAENGADTADVRLPPVGGALDYQLGGAYEPDAAVEIVGRDRGADPAEGRYSVCYVNGFQTQPGELDLWPEDLLLQSDGATVFDPDWPDEALLDTSTAERREAIVELVGPWIEGCAASGFDAVEFDNLDTFTRSDGALTIDDNLALAASFVQVAHDAGLAAGQKNAAEFAPRLRDDAGF
ncbi:MAG: endo alpha-1,4 polygalactosaminidase, partial [Microbacteriaceae bacterium]